MSEITPVEYSIFEVADIVRRGSYITDEGVKREGSFWRIVRILFSWTGLLETTVAYCAKRSIGYLQKVFAQVYEECPDRKEQLDRYHLIRSLMGCDMKELCADLESVSKRVNDLFVSYFIKELLFLGTDATTLMPPLETQCDLAQLYLRGGDNVPKDPKKAKLILIRLEKTHNPRALFLLSELFYAGGEGVPPNYKRALHYLRLSEQLDYPPAKYQLGCLYRDGYGVPKDEDAARRLFRQAAEAGYVAATEALSALQPNVIQAALVPLQRMFGTAATPREEGGRELSTLREQAIGQDRSDAQLDLGLRYLQGSGGVHMRQVDRARALLYRAVANGIRQNHKNTFERALDEICRHARYQGQSAVRGSSAASDAVPVELAVIPFAQRGKVVSTSVREDVLVEVGEHFADPNHYEPELAVACYKRAIEDFKSGRACEKLGKCYERGIGVKPNQAKALAIYRRGAELNYEPSLVSYASCLTSGFGGKRDLKKASVLLEQATDAGYVPAMWQLAENLIEGVGMSKDIGRAVDLFKRCVAAAASQGAEIPSGAYFRIAELYNEGSEHLPQDLARARELYMEAYNRRHIVAGVRLAEITRRGKGGVASSAEEAFKILERSYQLEHEQFSEEGVRYNPMEATLMFAQYYEQGVGCERNFRRSLQLYFEAARRGTQAAWDELLVLLDDTKDHGTRLNVKQNVPDYKKRRKLILQFQHKFLDKKFPRKIFLEAFGDPIDRT